MLGCENYILYDMMITNSDSICQCDIELTFEVSGQVLNQTKRLEIDPQGDQSANDSLIIEAVVAIEYANTLCSKTRAGEQAAQAILKRVMTKIHQVLESKAPPGRHYREKIISLLDNLERTRTSIMLRCANSVGTMQSNKPPSATTKPSRQASPPPNSFSSSARAPAPLLFIGKSNKYALKKEIGQGAFGTIFLAVDTTTLGTNECQQYAIKRISNTFSDPVVALQTLREIELLNHLKPHRNIISIFEILADGDGTFETFQNAYLVMELMGSDLQRVINSSQPLQRRHHRWFMFQLLLGVHRLHSAGILHRDLKPSNLLVDGSCNLKIADFGLSRAVGEDASNIGVKGEDEAVSGSLTEYVVTRWYRAPELLLTTGQYDWGVDIWSVGCIFAELLNRKPLFPGDNYVSQLRMILQTVGCNAEDAVDFVNKGDVRSFFEGACEKADMDGGVNLVEMVEHPKNRGQGAVPEFSEVEIDLLKKLLLLNPSSRITAAEALNHPYFKKIRKRGDLELAADVPKYGLMTSSQELEKGGTQKNSTKKILWEMSDRGKTTL